MTMSSNDEGYANCNKPPNVLSHAKDEVGGDTYQKGAALTAKSQSKDVDRRSAQTEDPANKITSTQLARRQERKKRHRLLKQIEQHHRDNDYLVDCFYDDNDNIHGKLAHDPFASLDSIIDQLNQEQRQRQQPRTNPTEESNGGTTDVDNKAYREVEGMSLHNKKWGEGGNHNPRTIATRMLSKKHKAILCNEKNNDHLKIDSESEYNLLASERIESVSPPDFDICVHDDHNDSSSDEEQKYPIRDDKKPILAESNLQVNHRPKKKKNRHDRNNTPRRSQLQSAVYVNNRFSGPSLKSIGRPKKATTHHVLGTASTSGNVENVNSIVGPRPSTWVCNPEMVQKQRTQMPQPLAKSSALVAATRYPFAAKRSATASVTVSSKRKTQDARDRLSKKRDLVADNNAMESTNIAPTKEDITFQVSFAPTFVPSVKKTKNAIPTDEVVEDPTREEDFAFQLPNLGFGSPPHHIPAIFTSTPFGMKNQRRNSSSKVVGKWGGRLLALRNTRSSNAARLQNSTFARHVGASLNDLRKRCKNQMDVTILGSCDGHWANSSEDVPIVVLGWIQKEVYQGESLATTPQGRNRMGMPVQEPTFAWMVFRLSTARSISLERRCQLRIYNGVILPSPVTTDLEFSDRILQCRHIVVCTELCERVDNK